MARLKTCSKCCEVKPLDEFGKDQVKWDGHDSICKECSRALRRAYYKRTGK